MSVRGLSGYTHAWVRQNAQARPHRDTFTESQARQGSNDLKILENENRPQEFSKDELLRLRDFMSKIGEGVDSIDGVIKNFERIDTKRIGKITAEQVKEFESVVAESEAAVAAQPIMLDQLANSPAMARASMESYLNRYTAKAQAKTSTFERSE